jgi:hypothetical protein
MKNQTPVEFKTMDLYRKSLRRKTLKLKEMMDKCGIHLPILEEKKK